MLNLDRRGPSTSRRTLIAGIAAAGTLAAITAGVRFLIDSNTYQVGDPHNEGAIRFYLSNPLAIDPCEAQDTSGLQVVQTLFDPLLAYDWEQEALVGKAAQTWESSDDETVFTFHLVPGATFHNGEPVTAESFKRAWERICAPASGATSPNFVHIDAVKGAAQMADGSAQELSGVEALDDLTLRVTLVAPMADFPYTCTHAALAPVPQAALDNPSSFAVSPIGNGPFMMDGAWVSDQYINLVRYDDYYGEPATLSAVDFAILQSPGTAFDEFEAGHVDFTPIAAGRFGETSMNYGLSIDGYTARPNEQVLTGAECNVYYLACNCQDKMLKSAELRRAISLAINRQNLCDTFFGGNYLPADRIVPPSLDDDPASAWPDSHYDPEAAKAILDTIYPIDESGSRKLRIGLVFNTGGGHEDILRHVASDLQAVGIEVDQSSSEWAAFMDTINSARFQVARFGWVADYPTMDNFLYPLFHSTSTSNHSFYHNAQVDEALSSARQIANEDERKGAYRKISALVGKDMPVIPLMFYSHNHVTSSHVEHLYLDPQERAHFETARVV